MCLQIPGNIIGNGPWDLTQWSGTLSAKPLHAKIFRMNKNIYLHFMSFLHINMTKVVEILPQVRQGPTNST